VPLKRAPQHTKSANVFGQPRKAVKMFGVTSMPACFPKHQHMPAMLTLPEALASLATQLMPKQVMSLVNSGLAVDVKCSSLNLI
jgi:hypothetical protein